MRVDIPSISADQMKQVDDMAVKAGLTVIQMMELASYHMARFIQNRFPNARKVLILAGPGHNGGDGIACARHLANWGYQPRLVLSHPEEKMKEANQHHLQLIKQMQISVHHASDAGSASVFQETEIVVDGLIGYSLQGDPREPIASLINQANASYKPVIAFDNPSGIDVTTGKPSEFCIKAEATLTLVLPKEGLQKKKANDYVGDLFLADLGIPSFIFEQLSIPFPGGIFSNDSVISLD
jgi:NAD(P)H-hydrate epimerase